jgi:hypothetical protein
MSDKPPQLDIVEAIFGEGFWPLGVVTAVLIKTIFGNGDLESSQKRSGVPEGTARVPVVCRYLSFLTKISPSETVFKT